MKSAEKQKIPISFNSYNSFFDYLTQDCPKEPSAYISWDCTRSKKGIYKEVSSKWSVMKEKLLKAADPAKTVPLMHFVLQEITSKKGRLKKKLKSQITNANMSYILNFLSEFLPNIINHRNSLRHYQATIKEFYNSLEHVSIDVDFPEHLPVPVKLSRSHGKGEVDHVGGIAKIAIQQEIANRTLLTDAEETVAFLEKKFQYNSEPKYVIEQIHEQELQMA